MEEQTIPFEMLIHPNEEQLKKRDAFISSVEKNVTIVKMDSDGIVAEMVVKNDLTRINFRFSSYKKPPGFLSRGLFLLHNFSRERRRIAMWVKCNPNPLGKQANDCVVRAISIATERSWQDVYTDLCREGRLACDMPSSNAVWGKYLQSEGFRQFLLPESCPSCITIRAFADRYPIGTYIIGTGTHAVTVIDGDYYDSWDSGDEEPSYFWRVR